MTRLTEALERARVIREQGADAAKELTSAHHTREDIPTTWDLDVRDPRAVADAPQLPMRPRAVTHTETPKTDTQARKDEPRVAPTGTFTKCPRCKRVQGVRVRELGFWGRRVLSLIRVRPYRCIFCGHRF